VAVLVCYDATSSLTAARESGAFDAVLVSPIENRRLVRAIVSAFWRRSALFFPAVAATELHMLFAPIGTPFLTGQLSWVAEIAVLLVPLALVLVATAVLLYTFVVYGCYGSILPTRPAGQTVAMVALLLGMQIPTGAMMFIALVVIAFPLAGIREYVDIVLPDNLASIPMAVILLFHALANVVVARAFYTGFLYRLPEQWRTDYVRPTF
jgi:hypothetical protein